MQLDAFQLALEEYPEIVKYVGAFQAALKKGRFKTRPTQRLKDSIVVFKKKKLSQANLTGGNIYGCDRGLLDLDANNNSKSRSSCLRCQKFKKKCTRDLPECHNCVSSEEMCVYKPRKKKTSKSKSEPTDRKEEQHPLPTFDEMVQQADSSCNSIHARPRTMVSLPCVVSKQPIDQFNGHSDLYRLLN